jgi:ferredoxin
MADPGAKVSENVDGPYFVDDACTACESCVDEAPNNFKMNDDGEYAYVFKQPENDEEETQCQEALDGCPAEAIGKA